MANLWTWNLCQVHAFFRHLTWLSCQGHILLKSFVPKFYIRSHFSRHSCMPCSLWEMPIFLYIYDDRQPQTFATIRSCNHVNQLCIRFIRKPGYKFFIWFKPRGLRTLYSDSPASNSHFSFGIKLMRRIKLLSHSNAGEHMSGRCSRTYNRTELWLI